MAKRRLPPRDPKTGRFVKRRKRTRRKAGRRRGRKSKR